jgi:hypothetical protein
VSGNGFPYPVFTGDSDPEKPFNRAAARNAAARAAGDVDVYVFNDADHAMSHSQVRTAVMVAYDGAFGVHPYTQVVVEDLDSGKQWPSKFNSTYTSGNIVVPRNLFAAVGGWDERFDRWGHEDIAFSKLLVWFGGPLGYVPGPVLVFDHERAWDERLENVQTPPLMDRYFDLRNLHDALAMAAEVKALRG